MAETAQANPVAQTPPQTSQVNSQTPAPNPVPQTSQVTSQTPATKPKNPKRVAAGKDIARRTRQARAAHKQAYEEKMAKQSAPAVGQAPHPVETTTETAPMPAAENGLTTTQLIAIAGIGVTLLTTYVKREDIKAFFKKNQATSVEQAPHPTHVDAEPSPQTPKPKPKKRGIRYMDD